MKNLSSSLGQNGASPEDLLLSSYDYELPLELIADRPTRDRLASRLLVYDKNHDKVSHAQFFELAEFLPPRSTLVFNNSKVVPCRILAQKESGGQAEIFFTSFSPGDGAYACLVKASGKRRVGEKFQAHGDHFELIEKTHEGVFFLRPERSDFDVLRYLEAHGFIPLPPYIRKGVADEQDKTDYQTVYATHQGSLAAPTAGLHFTEKLLADLKQAGHQVAYVTLHVGLGTFKPVKAENILDHHMHAEEYFVAPESQEILRTSKTKPIAVGTTSLRVLESSWSDQGWHFSQTPKRTSIFLHPGVSVKSISGLITNFHLPQSTLLMLVSSLLGRKKTLEIYAEAIRERYRFFSYGDASFLRL